MNKHAKKPAGTVIARNAACMLLAVLLLCLCGCGKQNTSAETGVCTVSICCDKLVGNEALNKAKQTFVPADGYILHETSVACTEGETVFDVLKRACKDNVCTDNCAYCQADGIQIEYAYTPVYGTYYIEGIHNLYEKDCGSMSGWVFLVNGQSASMGCSEIEVADGDTIEWTYTTGS